ncbi:MAG: aminopeptidase P family protein [Deltaproteobacteria bacterium]|nr:aminopeptidase P family protein [Deltaproteobacteria bacterium]
MSFKPKERRAAKARVAMAKAKLDALLVTDIKNIRYLTGFTGSSAYLVLTPSRVYFLTDSRYAAQSGAEVKGADIEVRICAKAVEEIHGILTGPRVGDRIGFEPDNLTYEAYLRFKKGFGNKRFIPSGGIIKTARAVKDAIELTAIKDSVGALDAGFEAARGLIAPGRKESDVAFEIEVGFKKAGADGPAFDTIIASGPRSALPHGKAGQRKMRKGELVVVDMGVLLNGYNSDETRTYCLGRPTRRQRNIYDTVAAAQEAAIKAIRPGATAKDVDAAARAYITDAGYGEYFGHGTGHGVGLDVHERPVLSPHSKDILTQGMVVTVEPGIYIPGWGGVRIEDMVLVTADGFEALTNAAKGLEDLR